MRKYLVVLDPDNLDNDITVFANEFSVANDGALVFLVNVYAVARFREWYYVVEIQKEEEK